METSNPTQTSELLRDMAERALRYLDGLDARSVAPSPAAIAAFSAFYEPLPDGPCDPRAVIEQLDTFGSPATSAMAGPRFFGFVIGGTLPVTLAANWLAGAWDQNTGLWAPTPATATLEDVALRWMVGLFGLPPETGGGFVTGATVANFSLSSWATTDADVEKSLAAMLSAARGLGAIR